MIFIIIIIGIWLRINAFGKGIWLDEFSTINLITQDDFLQALRVYDHPPLYFILLRWWNFLSPSEENLRLLSVFFGIATVIVSVLLANKYSKHAALLAGLITATLPILIRYSQEIRHYSLLTFLTAISFYFAKRYLDESSNSWWITGLSFSLVLSVLTHLIGIFLLFSVFIFLLFSGWSQLKNFWKTTLVFVPSIVIFFFIFFIFLNRNVQSMAPTWVSEVTIGISSHIFLSVIGFTSANQLLSANSIIYLPYIKFLTILLILFLTNLIWGRWEQTAALLLAGFTYWVQIFVFSALFTPIFLQRTILPGLIPLIIFVSVQISTIRSNNLKKISFGIVILYCSLLTASWLQNFAGRPIQDWKTPAQLIANNYEEGDVIVFYPSYAEGPTTFYLENKNNLITTVIDFDASPEKIHQILNQEIFTNIEFGAVYLLVLKDDNINIQSTSYFTLFETLEQNLGAYLPLVESDSILLGKYQIEE